MSARTRLLQCGGQNFGDHLFVPVAYHRTQPITLATWILALDRWRQVVSGSGTTLRATGRRDDARR